MSSKEVEIWGKPLIKMTVKDLREIAKEIPEITGVHGMKKEELIDALREVKGIEAEVKKVKKSEGVGQLKEKIKALKAQRQQALEAKDKKMATIYRRRISRLKKKTRRAAA
jgi:protein-arginine kinase activator protein McsA